MGLPYSPEALAFRNDLVLAICNGGFGKHYDAADAFMASHVVPLLAALQQVTAERDEALTEHTDMMWQRRRADERTEAAEAALATATAEAASLRAEVEAKDRARDDALMALKVYVESGHGGARCEVQEWLHTGAQGPVPFFDGALFRMWAKANGIVNQGGFLARAATAGEG